MFISFSQDLVCLIANVWVAMTNGSKKKKTSPLVYPQPIPEEKKSVEGFVAVPSAHFVVTELSPLLESSTEQY